MSSHSDTEQQKPQKSPHALREEDVLSFWNEKNIFKKTLEKDAPQGDFVFYDGPPFATGLPHYGHILPGTIKDVIPRWKTMQGYRVRRRWGWDTHGLPVENLIEKELGLKTKKDILAFGIDKFNEAARASVMRFADEWRTIVPRLGRWVDMVDDYRTMDATYTESVWWIFKTLYEKGLIYEGFKVMSLCPRCETTLSNFEVAQGYKDIADLSATVMFALKQGQKIGDIVIDENTYILAWTTTPWTLPGNVALAVGAHINYVLIKIEHAQYILAKELLHTVKDKQYEVISEFSGKDVIGLAYEPLFDYYATSASLKNKENGWKIYGADFVTTEDGTGVVHIAPAFGADDYTLLVAHTLPFVQHVTVDGHFKPEVTDFSGLSVKPKDADGEKDAHQKTDIEVIKWLAHHGRLFAKQKLTHPYPHCWRCETPLLNYAASSWFVKVTDIKDKMVKENKKVTWIPPEIGEGRFGNWLEGARDWAISRSRFWGAPIPVWKDIHTDTYHVLGSIADLKQHTKAKNTYYIIRHGQAESNVKNIISNRPDEPNHLTEKGKEQVRIGAQTLKDMLGSQKIDLIIVSPFVRTRETADIIATEIGFPKKEMVIEETIGEWRTGVWNGRNIADFSKAFPDAHERFGKKPEGGETYADLKKRMGDFLYACEKKYEGKTILVVTHETPATLLIAAAQGMDRKQAASLIQGKVHGEFYKNAEVRKLEFKPIPHNLEHELDFHRPYIDEVELHTTNGNKLIRVPDVFDCWFESGAMPIGEAHYPFCNEGDVKEVFQPKSGWFKKTKGYPADFIAEGLDQTRGWFYSMMVLGVALFGTSPYKKVVVNGLVLAEDGQKMSKSKKNYPDLMNVVNAYGADALRYYLMASPAVHAQDLCFSEKGVDEVVKKVINRLLNVVSFYEMYADLGTRKHTKETSRKNDHQHDIQQPVSPHVLDQWIISRLNETVEAVTTGLTAGEIDRAVRPFNDFVDDLSTWYLRRSRDRFKGEDKQDKEWALVTTHFVILEITKLLAPFMPFVTEEIYRTMTSANIDGAKESVHLESWPIAGKIDVALMDRMKETRMLSSKGLEARTVAKINVRQPLLELKIKSAMLKSEIHTGFIDLIKEEVNVKKVTVDSTLQKEVELDTQITPELKEEGMVRELIRSIQDLRKEKGLSVGDTAKLTLAKEQYDLAKKYETEIKKVTNVTDISIGEIMSL